MRYKDLSPFWKEVFFQNNYKGKDRGKIEPILEKVNPAITIETRIKSINDHVREAEQRRTDLSKMRESRSEAQAAAANANREQQRHEPVKVGPKVGRNDPCPCGSGLKYKNCHGKNE